MTSLKLIALAGAMLLLPFAASAADMPPMGEHQRAITVSGHGEVDAVPDQAVVTAGVTSSDKSAAAALSENAALMNRVFDALKAMGVSEKDISTSNFSVSPVYAPYNANLPAAERITGYQVSNEVTVRLEHPANIGPAIDTLVSAGANQMNGISFSFHDPKPLLASAREHAVDDAITRAMTLARAAHVTLGPILSIKDTNSQVVVPVMRMAVAEAAPAPTPIARGEQTLSADVTITWLIK